jgi:hypothetical protein
LITMAEERGIIAERSRQNVVGIYCNVVNEGCSEINTSSKCTDIKTYLFIKIFLPI